MSIFELTMLLCFGLAWPFSIYNSIKSKSTKGKSLIFMLVLILGYIAGIFHKLIYSYDVVIYFYIINVCMVSIDCAIWILNRQHEKRVVI